jgi:hypothetical protein
MAAKISVLTVVLAPIAPILTGLKGLVDLIEADATLAVQMITMLLAGVGVTLPAAEVNAIPAAIKEVDDLISLLAALASSQPVTVAQVEAGLTDLVAAFPEAGVILNNPAVKPFIDALAGAIATA